MNVKEADGKEKETRKDCKTGRREKERERERDGEVWEKASLLLRPPGVFSKLPKVFF